MSEKGKIYRGFLKLKKHAPDSQSAKIQTSSIIYKVNIWSILMSLSISWIQVMINISGQDQYIRSVYIFTIYRYIFHLTVYKCCHIHTLRPRKNNNLFPLTRPTLVFFFFFTPHDLTVLYWYFYGKKIKKLFFWINCVNTTQLSISLFSLM